MKVPTELTTEAKALEADAKAREAEIVHAAETYEMDLISFVAGHVGLAVQLAVIVAIPVAAIAYVIGRSHG